MTVFCITFTCGRVTRPTQTVMDLRSPPLMPRTPFGLIFALSVPNPGVISLGDTSKCAVASLYLRPRHKADADCDALALTAADAAHAPAGALIADHCVPAMLQALHASKHRLNQHLDHFWAVIFEASTMKLQTPAGGPVGNHRVPAVLGALQACENRPMTHLKISQRPHSAHSISCAAALHAWVRTWLL